jgi:hypothetical protein
MNVSPVTPLGRKFLYQPRGTRSDREIYLEQEVDRLTSKRLEDKKKLQTLKKQLNEAIIEKEVSSHKIAMNQKSIDQKLQELRQRNQVLSNAGMHESITTVLCDTDILSYALSKHVAKARKGKSENEAMGNEQN